MTDQNTRNVPTRAAGAILLGLSALSLLFIAHHPTLGSPGYDTLAQEAVAESAINGAVHGALILITIGFYIVLSVFSDSLGRNRLSARAARTSLAAATIAMTGAGLVSGFIVPDTAQSLMRAGAEAEFPAMLRMLGETNQVLAKTGTLAYGAAILFWSLRLVAMPGLTRVAGVFGVIAGGAFWAGILSEVLDLDVRGMALVLAVMGVWFVLIAVPMLRGTLSAPQPS